MKPRSLGICAHDKSVMKKIATFLNLFTLAIILLAASELLWLHWLRPLDHRLTDILVRQHAVQLKPDPDIVIVNIDDASLARMEPLVGSWFWPRSVHAEMVEGISRQAPQAIVFDLSFVERDKYRPESDALFNQVLRDKQKVFFALVRRPAEQDDAGARLSDWVSQLGLIATDEAEPDARAALMPPLAIDPELWRLGTVNFLGDSDGVGRRYHVYSKLHGWLLPSLPARVVSELGYPVPRVADITLSWRGGKHPYRRIPFADLYDDIGRRQGLRDPGELSGKIVIIGADASAFHDVRATPIDSLYSGLDILATAIDNLKNGSAMQLPPAWSELVLAIILIVGVYAGFSLRVNVISMGAFLLALTLTGLLMSYLALSRNLLLHPLAPFLLAWLYYFTLALRQYLLELRSKERAVELFGRFVNPVVVKELISSGGLSREGESRDVSVLFSDIRGFTGLAEKRCPQEVVNLLNRYFSLQVEVIFRHGGSLDKFIGDAIMAFWGAPLDDPGHAIHAVEAALDMAKVLQQFKQELAQDTDFDIGIGIHSGPAVVGFIGSEQRKEYTAIGDTVNLASRIEGLTKGVARILVSEETRMRCGERFDFTPLGFYKVKGRQGEVALFTPIRENTE
jgi:adenylate cyclase